MKVLIERKKEIVSCLYWFIGINTFLQVFRAAYKSIMILYAISLTILAVYSMCCFGYQVEKRIRLWVLVKFLSYILAIIVAFTISVEFGYKNIVACYSIILVLIIIIKKPLDYECKAFIKGLKISIIINLLYSFLDFLCRFLFDFNLTTLLLRMVGMNDRADIYDSNIGNRITGLTWDPFVLGGCCAFGFYLFKSKYLRGAIIFILLCSGSRSGILGFVLGLIIEYRKQIFKKSKALIIIFVVFVILFLNYNIILDFALRGFDKSSFGYMRVEYITLIPSVIRESSILQILFGGAPAYSGGRIVLTGISSMINETYQTLYWTIESDWGNAFYGRGVFGFISYIIIYLGLIKKQSNKRFRALFLTILFAGIGYYYDTSIYVNLILHFLSEFQDDCYIETHYREKSKKLLGI